MTNDSTYSNRIFETRYESECQWVHRFMTWLMAGQWILGVAFALFWSPFTWIGSEHHVHTHLWAAVIIGSSLTGFAVVWIRMFPKESHTRHVVAITQMLWSALLIHLSGGRIETHFHVFASLAILSIYRDWKILITATAVVAVDHFVRGVFYPLSVFGVVNESPFRWIEHAAWMLFEVSFLVPGCHRLRNEVRELCVRQNELTEAKRNVDEQVAQRTLELRSANENLAKQTAEAEKLALVARFTDNAVVITNSASKIEWVNAGFTRITGYSLEEVAGKRPMEFQFGEETDPATVEMMKQSLDRKEGFNTEVINYRKNGDPFWLGIEARPIINAQGVVDRFIAIQSDITHRKEMQISLADAEERLRSIIENVPGAFYRRQMADDKTLYISRCIENLSGHNPTAFTENKLRQRDLIHLDDLEKYDHVLATAANNDGAFELEYRIVDIHENERWVSEKGRIVEFTDGQKQERCVDGILFDISERVEAELRNQALQQELIDVSRQAGMAEIATGVLHNVGNILNSVNVSASVIRKQFSRSPLAKLEKLSDLIAEHEMSFDEFISKDSRGQKVPAYIQKVTSAISSERDLVNREFNELVGNIEHIKEIVSAQQSMSKSSGMLQELNPNELIRDVLSANKASLHKHEVKVERHIEVDIPNFVSDKHRILQILVNLVKNAKDSLVENQTRDPRIELHLFCDEDCIVFRVSDNGIGIDKEKLDKIFQHGFTTKKTGHGFGLHSSANAAAEMGGSLTVTSGGIGHGATFELRLPFESQEATYSLLESFNEA